MSKGNPFRQKKRLTRMMRLLARIRPQAMPITYRRNRVVLLHDGPSFFQSLFSALRAAQQSILLEYYIIHDDQIGRALAEELAAAVSRGVRVALIYDYIGCVDTPSSYFKNLARQGIELVAFNVPSFRRGIHWFDKRDHRKMVLIDSSTAFLGGFNIGDEYAGLAKGRSNFRDLGFSVSGSAVGELERIFLETWQMERKGAYSHQADHEKTGEAPTKGRATVVIVSGGPHHRRSYIRSAFLAAIASASEEILIATPYFVPGPRIVRSLLRAARRGVRISLLLPARSDVPAVRLLGRSYYAPLLSSGIEIFELEGDILHSKVMLIDSERTVIGSANLDQRSFHRNFEINCVIDNSTFGRQIRKMLQEDLSVSRRIELGEHERRGLVTRVLEKVIRLFGWFL
jgi:cardiolipin synthase